MRAASRTGLLMLLAVLVVAVMVVAVVPAGRLTLAHDDDIATTPAAGETVPLVDAIVVDFGAPVDGVRFEVVDPSGDARRGRLGHRRCRCCHLHPEYDGRRRGEYTVRYTAQAADGHLVAGEFAFSVGPAASSSNGAGMLRWIAGAAAIVATLSIAAAASVARRKRADAVASTNDAGP